MYYPLLVVLLIFSTKTLADCPNNSVTWQSKCYTFNKDPLASIAAELNCTKAGGHLASIHDGFTNAFLAQEGEIQFGENVKDFWIGANTLINPGNWSWTDGTLFDFSELNVLNSNGTQNCAALSGVNGYWNAEDCFATKPYVCEISNNSNYAHNCSYGWVYFEGTNSCYYHGTATNWTMAEQYCVNNSAHLTSLHSPEEADFLDGLLSSWRWIGLFSADNQQTWRWTDDTPFDFGTWANGYPNRTLSSCVNNYRYEYMNDYECAYSTYFICKKPASTTFSLSSKENNNNK